MSSIKVYNQLLDELTIKIIDLCNEEITEDEKKKRLRQILHTLASGEL
jgi:hypothetical protein